MVTCYQMLRLDPVRALIVAIVLEGVAASDEAAGANGKRTPGGQKLRRPERHGRSRGQQQMHRHARFLSSGCFQERLRLYESYGCSYGSIDTVSIRGFNF